MFSIIPNNQISEKRIFYFDALRSFAIMSVILFHVFMACRGIIVTQYGTIPTLDWCITDIIAACFRCCVDIFLMLSGALSLGRVWDIKSFLSKRLPRIALPFIFWGVILSIFMVSVSYCYPNLIHTVNSYDLISFLNYLYNSFMSHNRGFTQYWFFWMILGTYLIMPIFNKWLLHSNLKEAEYFLVIWLITCLFDGMLGIEFPIKLTYFTGPIGMVILGYYLRHTERKIFNNPYWAIVFILIGAISLLISSYTASSTNKIVFLDRYSILYAIEVTGIFALFKNYHKFRIKSRILNNPYGIFRQSLFSIAKHSYGIYLLHRVFIVLIFAIFANNVPYKLLLLLLFGGSLFISWIIMGLLNKIPYINQVIGSK